MRFGIYAVVAAAVLAILAAPADAQTKKKKRIAYNRSNYTVIHTRDEDGRARTRIVVQPRSFLNPGTQTFPGERRYNDGVSVFADRPTFHELDNTIFSPSRPVRDPFDLPSRNNPAFPQ